MRVSVDPTAHDPADPAEFVASGTIADDICLDEDAGLAYITTHRENTIDRVPLAPGGSGTRQIVAGDPFDDQLAGPSSAAWGRRPGDYGRSPTSPPTAGWSRRHPTASSGPQAPASRDARRRRHPGFPRSGRRSGPNVTFQGRVGPGLARSRAGRS